MNIVIQACCKNSLIALESPKWTGKTLCLHCASLGQSRVNRHERREHISSMSSEEAKEYAKHVPVIYYSSRTHSQFANVMKELEKTCYKHRTATISSGEMETADVLFLPYDYIFYSKFRKELNLRNDIVLVDEAHDIEVVCENSKSFEFSVKLIDECLIELSFIKNFREYSYNGLGKELVLKSIDLNKFMMKKDS